MAKYTITNQKELRRSFWEFCKEFGGEFEREANKKKHSFSVLWSRGYAVSGGGDSAGEWKPYHEFCVSDTSDL